MSKFYLAWGLQKNLLPQLSFLLYLLLATGCTPRYVYTPTIAQRALEPNIMMEGVEDKIKKDPGFQITDADIFAFTNDIKQAWRSRSQAARSFGVLTGVSRVGLAGAATTVAATKGLGSSGDTIPVLTGIATFIGEIFGFVDPGGRSEAYQDGLKLILDAEAEYLDGIPQDKKGLASGTDLTDAGKTLFKRVNAAIVVVDKALQSRIPTKEEVEAATSRISTATTGSVHGKVKKTDKSPAPGATVELSRVSDGSVVYSRIANSDGEFRIPGVAVGNYKMRASLADSLPSDSLEINIVAGSDLEKLLSLK